MVETEGTGRELKDQVISINRVTKVVKGGKNLSFSVLVVVGDQQGRVGYGMGKAKEVPVAIKKGLDKAKRDMIEVPMSGFTVPHAVMGTFGSGRVMIKPAKEGTGVIAGGGLCVQLWSRPALKMSSPNHWARPIPITSSRPLSRACSSCAVPPRSPGIAESPLRICNG